MCVKLDALLIVQARPPDDLVDHGPVIVALLDVEAKEGYHASGPKLWYRPTLMVGDTGVEPDSRFHHISSDFI